MRAARLAPEGDPGGPGPAPATLRLGDGGHARIGLEPGVQMIPQAARAETVNHVQHLQTGGNGPIDEPVQPQPTLLAGLAPQVYFVLGRGRLTLP